MRRISLEGSEEITNIRLKVGEFEQQITPFYDQEFLCLVNNAHG